MLVDTFKGYEQGASYIIVYDTFGDGLRSLEFGDVDIYHSEDELKEGIIEAYYRIPDCNNDDVSEDKVDRQVIEAMVVCKVVDMNDYAREVVQSYLDKQASEEYQTYLKLREKFDPLTATSTDQKH